MATTKKKDGPKNGDKKTVGGAGSIVVGETNTKSRRSLKVAAVVVIALFVVIVIIGTFRYSFHPRDAVPTDAQVLSAKSLVGKALAAKGDDVANYTVHVGKHLKTLGKKDGVFHALEISLISNSTRHSYLVDIDNNVIVMHSEIDVYVPADARDGWRPQEDYCRFFGACHSWNVDEN